MSQPAERADARANRVRLIHAAHQVFRERGLDAEMKEIAERAGVGMGTVYRNFPSKDDLIVAIVSELVDHMRVVLDRALSLDDPIHALRDLLHGGFALGERFGDMGMILHGKMPEGCRTEFERLDGLRRVGDIIRKGIAARVFRADLDPEVFAVHVIASFQPWTAHQLRATRGIEKLVDAHLDLFLRGALDRGAESRNSGTVPGEPPRCRDIPITGGIDV